MKRLSLLLVFLAGCAPVAEEALVEPILVEDPAARSADITPESCAPDGDGIGGTGCPQTD